MAIDIRRNIYAPVQPIVFGNLGTATKAIDFSSSGLSGATDYWFYGGTADYWAASGALVTSGAITAGGILKSNMYISSTVLLPMGTRIGVTGADIPVVLGLDTNSPLIAGNYTYVGYFIGDGVSNGTTTITDVGGAAHGLSLAVGDLAHITGSTTAGDKGLYRIVSDDGTNIVLDRALAGSDTDVTVRFYKDIVVLSPTDGTNGQHLVGFSHQDKPLVIGGDRAGTGGGTVPASGNSAFGGEDVLIGNQLAIAAGTVDIPLTDAHTWDALATNIPAAAANDDLALVTGTTGTDAPSLQAGDIKTTDSERYAGFLVRLPMWYNPGSTVKIRLSAGMKTTVADTSCVLDLNVYTVDYANNDLTVSGDLCETAAQSMNSTTFANLDFTIDDDAAGYVLAPGSILQVKVIADYTDGSTGTAVIPTIRHMELIITR